MNLDIVLVLLIIAAAIILFISNKLRVDLVALLVLGALVLTGLVNPSEALSGFSNPAVITVWAIFILSGGLTRTGIANIIGKQVMRVAGNGQFRLIFFIMLTAALLSAFMNNVGVAALLLPAVIVIARHTNIPPSKLLMPLAFGALLGGLTTLIGTPPNILVSDILRENGLEPFQLFDFAPVGVVVMIAGILFMVFLGHRLLPNQDPSKEVSIPSPAEMDTIYQVQEQMLVLRIPKQSILEGMSLAESHLGSMLGLNVAAIVHNGKTNYNLSAKTQLHAGDRLLVVGRPDRLAELRKHQVDTLERSPLTLDRIEAAGISVIKAELLTGSSLIGNTLVEASFRQEFGLHVLAIQRNDGVERVELGKIKLRAKDILYVQGSRERMSRLRDSPDFNVTETKATEISQLHKHLLLVRVPPGSFLVGKTLFESRLGDAFGLMVLQISRGEKSLDLPNPNEIVKTDDIMLVQGAEENIAAVRGLEELEISQKPSDIKELETDQVGLVEAVLSPHGTLDGKSLSQLHFRERFGLNVLAIWRAGNAYRHELSDLPLRFGDALLLHGPREKFRLMATDPGFIVLQEELQEPPRLQKAPLAVAIMAAVFASVLFGFLPIAIAAVIGSALMVLAGCLTMDEAYRYIEWPAVFLIACMLPLGIALENSGAADFLANNMMDMIGDFGPLAVLAGLFILSVFASQVMPNPAVVVLMAPIAIALAAEMNVSPHAFMMGIAIAASASFISPVSHPANILVMGPGGYKFSNYVKVGLPLTLVVFVVVLLLLPIVWPF